MTPQKPKAKILVIIGPTASGKSELGVELAKKFNGEVISADSRQVYRGLNIGSGKVKKDPYKGHLSHTKVPFVSGGIIHHLLDVASPKQTFTVAKYQKLGKSAIEKILKKDKLPIIVGGTGFYIDSLVNDIIFPQVKPNQKLRKQFDKLTAERLFKILQKLDPRRAETIDQHNKRRLVRALEIIYVTGRPTPVIIQRSLNYNPLVIGIKLKNQKLRQLIHKRLLARIKKGLIKEVENLHANGLSWQRLDDLGLEYRWVGKYLQNLDKINACIPLRSQYSASTKKETQKLMLDKLETEIWHYAKRQMTWFTQPHDGIKNGVKWVKGLSQAEKETKKFLS